MRKGSGQLGRKEVTRIQKRKAILPRMNGHLDHYFSPKEERITKYIYQNSYVISFFVRKSYNKQLLLLNKINKWRESHWFETRQYQRIHDIQIKVNEWLRQNVYIPKARLTPDPWSRCLIIKALPSHNKNTFMAVTLKKSKFIYKFKDYVIKKPANTVKSQWSPHIPLMLFGAGKVSSLYPCPQCQNCQQKGRFPGNWWYSENRMHPTLPSVLGTNGP